MATTSARKDPTVYLWQPSASLLQVGHVAFDVTNDIYISVSPRVRNRLTSKPYAFATCLQDDIKSAGREPDKVVSIPTKYLDMEECKHWWQRYRNDHNYHLLSSNCANAVWEALKVSLKLPPDLGVCEALDDDSEVQLALINFPPFVLNKAKEVADAIFGWSWNKWDGISSTLMELIRVMGECGRGCCELRDCMAVSEQMKRNSPSAVLERLGKLRPKKGDRFEITTANDYTTIVNRDTRLGVQFRFDVKVSGKGLAELKQFYIPEPSKEGEAALKTLDWDGDYKVLSSIELRFKKDMTLDDSTAAEASEKEQTREAQHFSHIRNSWKWLEDGHEPENDLYEIQDNKIFNPANPKRRQAYCSAMKSFFGRRSTNSVTIVLLGMSGSGKSSTINSFFDVTICETGATKSCTSKIQEITVGGYCSDLGLKNSKITILDTPGFNDTDRGSSFDNDVLQSLVEYFTERDFMPTMILLAVNMKDNRSSGDLSHLSKYLRQVRQVLGGSVLDIHNPNIMLVGTHCCDHSLLSEKSSSLSKCIQTKLKELEEVAKQNLGILACPVLPAENKPILHNLPEDNDCWILPTGDLYPFNIYDAFIRKTRSWDPVGHSIVNEAFPKMKSRCFPTTRSIDITRGKGVDDDEDSDDDEIGTEQKKPLTALERSNMKDVKEKLQLQWKSMKEEEQRLCWLQKPEEFSPGKALTKLKNRLKLRDFHKSLPSSQFEKINFFRQLAVNQNSARYYQRAFGFEAPAAPAGLPLGKFLTLPLSGKPELKSSPFQLAVNAQEFSELGLVVPSFSRAVFEPTTRRVFHYGSEEQLATYRLISMGLIPSQDFKGTLARTDGFNLTHSDSFTLSYENAVVKSELKQNLLGLTPGFQKDLDGLRKAFKSNGKISEDEARGFIEQHGAFYVKEAALGGRVVFSFPAPRRKTQATAVLDSDEDNQRSLVAVPPGEIEFLDFFFKKQKDRQEVPSIRVDGGAEESRRALEQSKSTEEFLRERRKWRVGLFEDLQLLDSSTRVEGIGVLLNECSAPDDAIFRKELDRVLAVCTSLRPFPKAQPITSRKDLRSRNVLDSSFPAGYLEYSDVALRWAIAMTNVSIGVLKTGKAVLRLDAKSFLDCYKHTKSLGQDVFAMMMGGVDGKGDEEQRKRELASQLNSAASSLNKEVWETLTLENALTLAGLCLGGRLGMMLASYFKSRGSSVLIGTTTCLIYYSVQEVSKVVSSRALK